MTVDPSVTDRLGSAVADLASREPRLCFAYVFGSTVRGTTSPASDTDVAVYLTEQLDLLEEAGLEQALSQRLGQVVDLLVLNRAPLWLQFRVLREGELLYSRDEPARVRFRERVEKRFLDFKPLHDDYLRMVRQRARAGRLSRG